MNRSITARDGILRGGAGAAIRALLLVALAVSAYLLSVSLSGGQAVGCGPGSGCDAVLQSRWAYLLGIPVSVFALLVDGALLITTFSCGVRSTPQQRRKAWEILFPGALMVLGAALWFVLVQAVIIKRFCPWCMTAHLSGSVAAVLLLLRLPITGAPERKEKDPGLTSKAAMRLGAVAVILVAVLAAAQIAVAPKTYTVKSIVMDVTNAVTAPQPEVAKADAKVQTNAVAAAPDWFAIYGGAVKVDLNKVPVWGPRNAPHKLVSLYDYTCHHCALMHRRIAEVRREHGDKLAVISLPMPLDSNCNSNMVRTPRPHVDGCVYARLGLAVWRAKPEALEAFDDWLFDEVQQNYDVRHVNQPPPLTEVTNRAAQAVGGLPVLEKALQDPWIDEQIGTDVAIYTISYRQFRNGSMPQFLMGSNIVSGTLETAKLREFVGQYVGK